MADKGPTSPANPRRLLIIVSGILAIIIIAGSILAARQAGFNFNSLRTGLGQVASRIGGANLVVTIASTKLPADGQSQTLIEATLVNTQTEATASIISGDGQIARGDTAGSKTQFIYTAGAKTGNTVILIKAGALEEQVVIEVVEAVQPTTPTITEPPDGSKINDPYPFVAGTGPANAKIAITNNGSQNTTTTINDQGGFRIQLEKPLYNGQHTLAATATNELGVVSPTSNLVTITIATDPITLDANNIRVVPKSVTAGESFAVFVPASIGTTKVILEIAGEAFELFDYNKSSIFMNTLPAPDQPGVYFGDIILVDLAGNASRFEQLVRLSVVS